MSKRGPIDSKDELVRINRRREASRRKKGEHKVIRDRGLNKVLGEFI